MILDGRFPSFVYIIHLASLLDFVLDRMVFSLSFQYIADLLSLRDGRAQGADDTT
jgi:hypothetical protein